MIRTKITTSAGADLTNNVAIAPVNLALHSPFSNASVTLCGKEIGEKDTLYPYREYLETLLTYGPDVLDTRLASQGSRKDGKDALMDATTRTGGSESPAFL
jgi:hypothetical protein